MKRFGFLSLITFLLFFMAISCTKRSSYDDINAKLTTEEKSAFSKIKDLEIK